MCVCGCGWIFMVTHQSILAHPKGPEIRWTHPMEDMSCLYLNWIWVKHLWDLSIPLWRPTTAFLKIKQIQQFSECSTLDVLESSRAPHQTRWSLTLSWIHFKHRSPHVASYLKTYKWWFQICFIFIPTWGNDPIWRAYFSNGLKPPTSN